MPRRYYNYEPRFQPLHILSTVGSWCVASGIILTFTYLMLTLRKKKDAPPNPWGARGLEWTIPSPPPLENFVTEPVITDPYPYGEEYDHKYKDLYGGAHV